MFGSVIYVLILALTSRGAGATPVNATGRVQSHNAHCTARARDLLAALGHVLGKAERIGSHALFRGFNCSDLAATVNPHSQTAVACQPTRDVRCSDPKPSPFSKSECLQNIANDLWYYRSLLSQYASGLDRKANAESVRELSTVTDAVREVEQSCELLPEAERYPNPNSLVQAWSLLDRFEARKELCKKLKGFHARAITLNRALGYVCAG